MTNSTHQNMLKTVLLFCIRVVYMVMFFALWAWLRASHTYVGTLHDSVQQTIAHSIRRNRNQTHTTCIELFTLAMQQRHRHTNAHQRVNITERVRNKCKRWLAFGRSGRRLVGANSSVSVVLCVVIRELRQFSCMQFRTTDYGNFPPIITWDILEYNRRTAAGAERRRCGRLLARTVSAKTHDADCTSRGDHDQHSTPAQNNHTVGCTRSPRNVLCVYAFFRVCM